MTLQEDLSKVLEVRSRNSFLDDFKEEDHKRQILDATRSKFLEFGNFFVLDEDPGLDEFYAICLVSKGKKTRVEIDARSHESFPTIYDLPNNSILIGVSNLPFNVTIGEYELSKFKVVEKPSFGKGAKLYRTEITFSDTYYINVFADSEQHAIDQAYRIDMPNWTHEWPVDPELDRHQVTRSSKWGKKMISAKEYDEQA
jgi:hypothetical protein